MGTRITAVAVVVNWMSSSSGDRIFRRSDCGWLFEVHELRLLLLLLLLLLLMVEMLYSSGDGRGIRHQVVVVVRMRQCGEIVWQCCVGERVYDSTIACPTIIQ